MRAFYTVLCLFLIMTFAIGINHFYIGSLSEELILACESLEQAPDTQGQVEWLHEHWQKNRKYVQITVNHTEIELIDNAIDELLSYSHQGEAADFEKAKQVAINALEEFSLSEHLSFFNIL